MSVFSFKKFKVVNERSAMKVNTDGVLLGAAMTLSADDLRLLDIGTGTGTIALMAAQRLDDLRRRSFAAAQDDNRGAAQDDNRGAAQDDNRGAAQDDKIHIDAIDIDEPSASEAKMNFEQSPWAANLSAHNLSLDDFSAKLTTLKSEGQDIKYDLIFSNPPYFEDSLTAPDERKSTARHTSDGLSYRDIFDFSKQYLTENGRVALVLPADQEAAICRYARMSDMHLLRVLRIRTVPRKAPSRVVIEFSKQRVQEVEDTILTIQNEGQYTQEYLSLTKEFYLFA
jgi:tRNA1Val (adenine37-N6)-methyltransferase